MYGTGLPGAGVGLAVGEGVSVGAGVPEEAALVWVCRSARVCLWAPVCPMAREPAYPTERWRGSPSDSPRGLRQTRFPRGPRGRRAKRRSEEQRGGAWWPGTRRSSGAQSGGAFAGARAQVPHDTRPIQTPRHMEPVGGLRRYGRKGGRAIRGGTVCGTDRSARVRRFESVHEVCEIPMEWQSPDPTLPRCNRTPCLSSRLRLTLHPLRELPSSR